MGKFYADGAPKSARPVNAYFWRTYDQKEIDLVEEGGGRFLGLEFKWQGEVKKATVSQFQVAYPGAKIVTVTPENFEEYI